MASQAQWLFTLAFVTVGAAGCGVVAWDHEARPRPSVPAAWDEQTAEQSGGRQAREVSRPSRPENNDEPTRWWQGFGDETLDRLVETALATAPNARVARARLTQARAVASQALAARLPSVDLQGSASARKQVAAFGSLFGGGSEGQQPGAPTDGAPPEVPGTFTAETYQLELAGLYQADLWGQAAARHDAARARAASALAEAGNALAGLAANTVSAYLSLIEQQARRDILEEQLAVARARLHMVRTLYEGGLTSFLSVAQQRRQVATRASQLAAMVAADTLARARLAALVGKPPRHLALDSVPARLPDVRPIPDVGVPADVIAARPDLRAARRRLDASDREVAAAIAGRLPRLRLQGTIGYGGLEPAEVFDNFIWSAMATVTQPLFRGGDIGARIASSRAQAREASAQYARLVVQALVDVETALASERQATARLEALEEEKQASLAAVYEAEQLFRQGLADFLSLLQAESAYVATRLQMLQASRRRLTARVDLYRALGGNWEAAVEDEGEDSQPAVSQASAGRHRTGQSHEDENMTGRQ